MLRETGSRDTVPWASMIAAGILAVALLGAPLPFGSVVPDAAATLRLAAFAALVPAALARRRGALGPGGLPIGLPWLPVAALASLALLAVAQSLPWPASWVEWLSPQHARVWRDARAVLDPAALPRPALSLAPPVTRTQIWVWSSLAAAFLAAALVGRRRLLRRALAAAVIAAALFEVLYGARRWLAHATTIWGIEVPGVSSRLRGTFVNPNHLATHLELALPLLFGWGLWGMRKARREISAERRLLLVAPPAVLGVTVLAGLAFTASRGGLAGGVMGLLAMALLTAVEGSRGTEARRAPRGGRRLRAPLAVISALLALGIVGLLGFERAYGRVAETSLYEVGWGVRAQVDRETLTLWTRYPWLGTGLGSFREAFPTVQPAGVAGTWPHAHCDPLELLATGGVAAALAAAIGIGALLFRLLRGLRLGLRTEDRVTALAGVGIAVSLLVHETVDYGLTQPANAFTAAVLLGAAAHVRLRPTGAP